MKKDYGQYDHPRNDCYWLKRGYLQEDIPAAKKEYNKRYGHSISNEQKEKMRVTNSKPDSAFQKMMKARWSDPSFREKINNSDKNSWKSGKRDRNNLSSRFTIRYWVNQGLSEEDAKKQLSELNCRDQDYFIEKYGSIDRHDTL